MLLKTVGACSMKKFADIDISSINSLNLAKLRQVRAKFAEAIMQHFDIISQSNDANCKQIAKEIENYKGFNTLKHLENYSALRQYETSLRHANLFDSTTQPSLDQLLLLAHKHAPDDWRSKLYLQDDVEMISAYKSIKQLDTYTVQTFADALRQNKREQELINKWELLLRRHYMAALYMNMRKVDLDLERLAKLYKATEFPINEPYACAVQIVHLISIYEYLLLNGSENKNMLTWCNRIIHLLDVAIGVLKALPETREQVVMQKRAQTFMQYFHQQQTKFADNAVTGNFAQIKQLQKSAYLN